jgi:DNA polymerase-3 subunit delta
MSLDFLKQDIDSRSFRRIYYLYGSEPYLKRFYLNSLISAVLPENRDTDLHRYEGKGLDADLFSEELWLCPMGEYKIMLLCDLPNASPVTEFLSSEDCDIGEDTVVVIYQQTESPDSRTKTFKSLKSRLEKDGLLVEIKTVDDAPLARWVTQQFRRRGCEISAGDVAYFLSVEERNMESMLTEIDKIAAYCNGPITREALEKLCVKTVQARAYELNDLLLEKKADGVFAVWNDLRALRTPPQMVLGSLFSCFGNLYKLKALHQQAAD